MPSGSSLAPVRLSHSEPSSYRAPSSRSQKSWMDTTGTSMADDRVRGPADLVGAIRHPGQSEHGDRDAETGQEELHPTVEQAARADPDRGEDETSW